MHPELCTRILSDYLEATAGSRGKGVGELSLNVELDLLLHDHLELGIAQLICAESYCVVSSSLSLEKCINSEIRATFSFLREGSRNFKAKYTCTRTLTMKMNRLAELYRLY